MLARFRNDPLLQNADFRRYWIISTLNGFGSQITTLALPLCAVLLLHATPAQMGTLSALQAVPFALFGLPAGVLLDRYRRMPILLSSKAMFGLALGSVPIAWWLGWLSMPWLYLVAFLMGTGNAVGGTAEQVFLTFLIGREKLIDAQSKMAATDSASRLIGPGLGGILIQVLSAPVALALDAASFFYAMFGLSRMQAKEPAPTPSDQHPWRDMMEGLRFVWRHDLLRALAWTAGIWHVVFYGYAALSVLYATHILNLTPGEIGTAQMFGGLGVLASSLLLKPLSARIGAGGVIVVGLSCTAMMWSVMPLLPPMLLGSHTWTLLAYGAVTLVYDCGVMLFFMPYVALRQRVTPDEFLGRMISTMRFLTVATAPLGALAGGLVGEHFGIRAGLALVAVSALALTIWVIGFTGVRSSRQ